MAIRKSSNNRFRARAGYERVPGAERRYKDTKSGEILSRRQYLKRTEGITSLEQKAKVLKAARIERGEIQPMTRYGAIVKQYKSLHPDAHVRGPKAKEFREQYSIYTTLRGRSRENNYKRIRSAVVLGVMTPAQAYGLYPELRDDPMINELDSLDYLDEENE